MPTSDTGGAVRNICLVAALLLALPLSANAQRHSGHARGSGSASGTQGSQQKESASTPAKKSSSWNGQRQDAWWEHQGPPKWENGQHMQPRDPREIPGWTQGNVARAMLDQQHAQEQRAEQIRHGQVNPRRHSHNYQPSVVYVMPTYGYGGMSAGTSYDTAAAPPRPAAPAPATSLYEEPRVPLGALRLEVEPRQELQIFVDGVFVGTPADLGDELEMTPGPHRIELRARGYKSQAFDVGILEDKLITYRGTLERDAASAPPPVARPSGSKTMYVIPGCYMGNVSPKEMSLPAGCDISRLTTISP
jgi:hypothetical protein